MQKVSIQAFNLIGIAIRTTNENGQAGREIADLWTKFMTETILEKIPNRIDDTIYSLYTDYEGDHTQPYTAILGCKVEHLDKIPEGMTGKTIEGGNYVKTTAKGDLMQGLVLQKWIEIWNSELDRVYTADFEVFGEKARDPQNAEIDFLIAVK